MKGQGEDRWGDPPHVTSPTWGPPPPFKQPLRPHPQESAYFWNCIFFYTNRPRMNELIHWFPMDGRLIRVEKMPFQKSPHSCWRGLWHIRHLRNKKGTGAEMRPAIVSGIVTEDASISYWPIFSLSLVTVPEVFANVNSVQFPSLPRSYLVWFLPWISSSASSSLSYLPALWEKETALAARELQTARKQSKQDLMSSVTIDAWIFLLIL